MKEENNVALILVKKIKNKMTLLDKRSKEKENNILMFTVEMIVIKNLIILRKKEKKLIEFVIEDDSEANGNFEEILIKNGVIKSEEEKTKDDLLMKITRVITDYNKVRMYMKVIKQMLNMIQILKNLKTRQS